MAGYYSGSQSLPGLLMGRCPFVLASVDGKRLRRELMTELSTLHHPQIVGKHTVGIGCDQVRGCVDTGDGDTPVGLGLGGL